jgi:hypothetical protein
VSCYFRKRTDQERDVSAGHTPVRTPKQNIKTTKLQKETRP